MEYHFIHSGWSGSASASCASATTGAWSLPRWNWWKSVSRSGPVKKNPASGKAPPTGRFCCESTIVRASSTALSAYLRCPVARNSSSDAVTPIPASSMRVAAKAVCHVDGPSTPAMPWLQSSSAVRRLRAANSGSESLSTRYAMAPAAAET